MGFKRGLFWGGLFGAAAGLLFAPQAGYKTRDEITNFLDQTAHDVNDVRYKLNNLNVAVHKLTTEGLASLKTAGDEIQQSLRQFSEESVPRLRRIEGSVNQLTQNIENQVASIKAAPEASDQHKKEATN